MHWLVIPCLCDELNNGSMLTSVEGTAHALAAEPCLLWCAVWGSNADQIGRCSLMADDPLFPLIRAVGGRGGERGGGGGGGLQCWPEW